MNLYKRNKNRIVIPGVLTEVEAVDVAVLGVVVGETVDVDLSVAVIKQYNK